MSDDSLNSTEDLGFTYRETSAGEVIIHHHGKLATVLRSHSAIEFLSKCKIKEFSELQQIMARLTGNYRRGNERTAKNHVRNKLEP